MTKKEFHRFASYFKNNPGVKPQGQLTLFPSVLKHLVNPSDYNTKKAQEGKTILYTVGMYDECFKTDGEFLTWRKEGEKRQRVHRKYIQRLWVYRYNW